MASVPGAVTTPTTPSTSTLTPALTSLPTSPSTSLPTSPSSVLRDDTSQSLRPLLRALAPMAIAGLLAGFATRQPALVALAAPATALITVALIRRTFLVSPAAPSTPSGSSLPVAGESSFGDAQVHQPRMSSGSIVFPNVELELSSPRVSAGDEIEVSVTLRSPVSVTRCDVAVTLPAGVEIIDGSAVLAMTLEADEPFVYRFRARTSSPGLAIFGPVVVRIDDRSGLFRAEQICRGPVALKVVARQDVLQTMLRAAVHGMHVGEQISHLRGDGFEFADMRAYVAGDSAKRIHWRASARTDDPVVIERRLDRNQDVLVVLDAHVNLELATGQSSLARSMEACVTIAGAHLGARDRVGFVGLGSVVSWVVPGTGQLQKFRILDAISSVSTTGEGIGRRVSAVPMAARPRRSLVVVVTSLVDARSTEMIRDLQAHRHDVCVVVVAPFDFVASTGFGRAERDITLKLWQLLHDEERRKLSAQGTAVVLWANDKPVELAVREVMAWRQKLRVGRRQMV